MDRKLKLALAALLGFSAACSSVRNAPVRGTDAPRREADTTKSGKRVPPPRIVVMYGVRPPVGTLERYVDSTSVASPGAADETAGPQPETLPAAGQAEDAGER